ncbi:MAG: hypothetical protein JNM07_03140 [Phycisphaerae bacterium]|nr:hypothetical protein [Phycisphaerae bacterium]
MRRGQEGRRDAGVGVGHTKAELIEIAGISPKAFDTLRKAARVSGPGHGGLNWTFTREDIEIMAQRAESGTFGVRMRHIAQVWRELLLSEKPDSETPAGS